MEQRLSGITIPPPLHHPLRGRSPSPSKLGEDLIMGLTQHRFAPNAPR
jgi:hypothetical protein